MTAPILRVERVSKHFGNVVALRDVTMSVPAGEVTCLLGDNGAGKSTLIQILAGVHRPTSGRYLVDGEPVDMPKKLVYKGMMFSDVPNLAFAIGYTNASWTLKCDLTAEYVCRLLNHMGRHGYAVCTPRVNDQDLREEPVIDFTSGYVRRALHTLPRQGSKTPWRLHQNYVKDLSMMRYGRVDDGTMEFKAAPVVRRAGVEAAGRG